MRLLPQSRRGTWLLATAAWAAACATIWFSMPAAPRECFRLPTNSFFVAFGPGGNTALAERLMAWSDNPEQRFYALDLVDVPTGRRIETVFERINAFNLLGHSTDGRVCLVRIGDITGWELFKVDAMTGAAVALALGPEEFEHPFSAGIGLSPDGRYAFFANYSTGSMVWDVASNRRHFDSPELGTNWRFSRDGRFLVVTVKGHVDRVAVIELDQRKVRTTVVGPPGGYCVFHPELSDNGSHIVGEFQDIMTVYGTLTHPAHYDPGDLWCWEVATGKVRNFGPLDEPRFAADGVLFGSRYDDLGRQLYAFDVIAEQVRFAVPTQGLGEWDLSPDGRTLLTLRRAPSDGPLEQFAHRLGLTWPFATGDRVQGQLYDVATGQSLGTVSAEARKYESFGELTHELLMDFAWLPDGKTIAVRTEPGGPHHWHLWDIPSRKPLAWFAAGVAGLALPFAWLARHRVRRLAVEAQAGGPTPFEVA